MSPPLSSKSSVLRAVAEYRKALRDHNLAASYKPPVTLFGRSFRGLSSSRKTNIILLPGFNSSGREWILFREVLKPMGRMVLEAKVNIELGNEALTDDLYEWLKKENLLKRSMPLSLIGFSNGGLIGRRLLQKYGIMNVQRLIMIASPNWGTSLAMYGQWFVDHPGLKDLMVGSEFLSTLNKDYAPVRVIPHYVITGNAAQGLEDINHDGIVWEDSATLGYTLPYVRVETNEAKLVYPPNSAWHLNLTCRAWRPLGPSNDRAWPITMRYVRAFLAE